MLSRFPEGEYRFSGRTVEVDQIEGEGDFTHLIPEAPVIVRPQDGELLDSNAAVIEWKPVTGPAGVEIETYEIIVGSDNADGEFYVLLPANARMVRISPEIFDPKSSEYKFEIIAREESGNQTITQGSFRTQ